MLSIIRVADHLSRSRNNGRNTGENLTQVLATSILPNRAKFPYGIAMNKIILPSFSICWMQ